MTYNKTTWVDGDVITAEKLNNIESGIEASGGNQPLIVNITMDESYNYSADKTYVEIKEAIDNGLDVKAKLINNTWIFLLELMVCTDASINFGTFTYYNGGGEEQPSITFYGVEIYSTNILNFYTVSNIR